MRTRFLGLAAFSAVLLASGAASAGVITVDGVGIPTGFQPGGFYIDTELSYENVVISTGQNFNGIFKVDAIHDAFANTTYSYVGSGHYLTGVFENFIATSVQLPTSTTAGTIKFTGGDIKYYVNTSDIFTNNSGNQATDITSATTGALWLTASAAPVDAAGDTLIITIPGGTNTLTSFLSASALAFLDVTGGDAAVNFNTNTFANAAEPGGFADILYQGSADSGAAGDFPISGTNHAKANVVPEPGSIAIFGAGLAAAAAFGARRRKAKKA